MNTQIFAEYLKTGIQYGHKKNEWNPKMAPYLLQESFGYHIIDLVQTIKFLKKAGDLVEKKIKNGENILFVGTTKLTSNIVLKNATRTSSSYITHRWLGGMLTNWPTIKKQVDRLIELEKTNFDIEFSNFSKKEISLRKKELIKLKKLFNGIKTLNKLPDLVIFTNQAKEYRAIQECLRLGIPCISIVDSNCNPDLTPYPIPANDDSITSLNFVLTYLSNRILDASAYNNQKEKN
jgi:small subunit ribosomal protein S2